MEHLSSGIVGLMLGALLGLAFTVLFEDALKNVRSATVTRLRQVSARGVLPSSNTEFRLGPLQTTVLIVEGDGQQVIDEQAVRVIVDPAEVELPHEIEFLRQEVREQQDLRRCSGQQAHWNGPTYAVAGLSVQRLGIDESPGVSLRLKSTDYFTFLATQQLDRELPSGTTLREEYLNPYPPTETPDFMCASFGTYIAVVTADNLAIFSKRSHAVGAFPGLWDASVNEALSRSLDSRGRTPPSLYDVARRGLLEELGLDPADIALNFSRSTSIERRTNGAACSCPSCTSSPACR